MFGARKIEFNQRKLSRQAATVFLSLNLSFLLIFLFVSAIRLPPTKINWVPLDAAIDDARRFDKLIFVHIYADWCGWCKIMELKTYTHPHIIDYIDKKYSAVKLNATYQDPIWFRGYKFVYTPEKRVHQLAYQLLEGNLKYPAIVIMNEKGEVLSPVHGYLDVATLGKILRFFGDKHYLKVPWSEYERTHQNK
jgi:thioredoxin-related protein